MQIDRIARKLQPLAPQAVRRWREARYFADPDLRELLDQQLVATAYDKLGDFHHQPLLSLPPPAKAKGALNLGTLLYDRQRGDFGLSLAELNKHMGIFGMSGAGKTNVAFHLLLQLLKMDIKVLFLDWKRSARHLLPLIKQPVQLYTPGRKLSAFGFNPFLVPPGLETSVYVNQITDLMASVYTLGEGARSILQKALLTCYKKTQTPQIGDILSEVEQINAIDRQRGWKISVVRALESMAFSEWTDTSKQHQIVNDLLQTNTFLELDGLDHNGKAFLSAVLCLWVYYVKLSQKQREKLDYVIFIEEAHHLLHQHTGKETVMEMLLRQARELSIGFVILNQHPSLTSKAVLNNIHTSICLNQKDAGDINRAASLSLLSEEDKHYLSRLPVGQGIVKLQSRWHDPVLVQFPRIPVQKGVVTDTILQKYLEKGRIETWDSSRKSPELANFGDLKPIPGQDGMIDGVGLSFLLDVLDYPDCGVNERYQRLGLGVGTANRLKQKLLRQSWLESQTVDIGKTRKVLLRLSRQARDYLQVNTHPNRESLTHHFWKKWYAGRLRELGYAVRMEVRRDGGFMDIMAQKQNTCIGVEIETGKNSKSKILSNIQRCLSACNRVWVVAPDQKSFRKIKKLLQNSGLGASEHVTLVLQHHLPSDISVDSL